MAYQYFLMAILQAIFAVFLTTAYLRRHREDLYGKVAKYIAERKLIPGYFWVIFFALFCSILSIGSLVKGIMLLAGEN